MRVLSLERSIRRRWWTRVICLIILAWRRNVTYSRSSRISYTIRTDLVHDKQVLVANSAQRKITEAAATRSMILTWRILKAVERMRMSHWARRVSLNSEVNQLIRRMRRRVTMSECNN